MRPRLGLAVSAALALGALALALSAAPQPQDARLERLYVKLERLNSLSPLVAGAGEGAGEAELEWEDEQLELIAQLAAEPGVSADQLDQLIRDLRLAHASSARLVSAAPAAAPPASSAAPPAAADYSDDDWHEEEEEEEEGDEEEEEEPEYAMDDEEPWDAEETAPARRPQAPPPPRAATDAPRPPDHHDADAENAGSRPSSRRRAALAHLLRAQELGRCQEPSPRVLPVQSLHPHAAKIYLPHCVILHRCAADTGCCLDGTHVCAPLTIQRIRLPFYILSVGSNNVEEDLWFYNHTKCTCMNRTDAAASRAANGPLRGGGGGGSVGNMAPRDDESTHRPQQRAVSADIGLMATQEPLVLRRCSCPKEFSASTASEPEGECRCECRERQSDCSRLKKGKEHFGLRDRLCIKRGQCSPPQCEFGEYNTAAGRCPRRRDPLDLPAALAHRAARLTSRLL